MTWQWANENVDCFFLPVPELYTSSCPTYFSSKPSHQLELYHGASVIFYGKYL